MKDNDVTIWHARFIVVNAVNAKEYRCVPGRKTDNVNALLVPGKRV